MSETRLIRESCCSWTYEGVAEAVKNELKEALSKYQCELGGGGDWFRNDDGQLLEKMKEAYDALAKK